MKKILLLPTLIFLVAVFSIGTTFGRYDLGQISFPDANWDVIPIKFDTIVGFLPSAGETPGIVEETPTTVYQVQPGDTLASIAEKFHTTAEALIAYNEIANPDTLQAGTILRISPADYAIPEAVDTISAQPATEAELSSEVISESETTEEVPDSPEFQSSDSTEDVTNNGTEEVIKN